MNKLLLRFARQAEFWVMILAWVAHSLSTTTWTFYGFVVWACGMALIWVLYALCRWEATRSRA